MDLIISSIFVELFPSPYGFMVSEQSLKKASRIAFSISTLLGAQLITEEAISLPFCRSPILTVAFLNEGTSYMPQEELPTTASI